MTSRTKQRAGAVIVGIVSGMVSAATIMAGVTFWAGDLHRRVATAERDIVVIQRDIQGIHPILLQIRDSSVRTEQSMSDICRRIDRLEERP